MEDNTSIRRLANRTCRNLRGLIKACASTILIVLGTPAARSESVAPRSAVYTIEHGDTLRVLIWQAPVTGHLEPAVVLFHGGGWLHGRAQQFRKICEILSIDGVTCVSVDYTLGGGDLAVAEAGKAVSWIRANAASLSIDPLRIAVGGMSVGGFLAASTVLLSDRGSRPVANAMVLMSPVLDSFPPGPDISLADHIRGALPPTRIFHGTDDHLVPIQKTEHFVEAARRAGSANVVLYSYPDRGHGAFRYMEGAPSKDFFNAVGHIEQLFVSLGWINCPPTRTADGTPVCHG